MYWKLLARLVAEHRIVIERPTGTMHPRYPEIVYPFDYGYLEGTTTVDGGGIDIVIGTLKTGNIQGIICTVDIVKNDAEIKILYNCSEEEVRTALSFFNSHLMGAVLVPNPQKS